MWIDPRERAKLELFESVSALKQDKMSSTTTFAAELVENAAKIASTGKGILAADESTGTIGKRFADISVENSEDNRRKYRQLLFATEGELYSFANDFFIVFFDAESSNLELTSLPTPSIPLLSTL